MPSEKLADRVRQRVRDEMHDRQLSQRDISNLLGGSQNGWSQSRVAKLLTARVEMGVNDLEGLCFALGLHASEVVRDRGLEFFAEMTPTELRILERLRKLPTVEYEAFLVLLDVKIKTLKDAPYGRKNKTAGRR